MVIVKEAMSESSSKNNFLFYAVIAAGIYFFFIKKDGTESRAKVANLVRDAKEIEAAATQAATAGAAKFAKEEEEDDELTVPVTQTGMVDYSLSGKELLGLQDGAGKINPV